MTDGVLQKKVPNARRHFEVTSMSALEQLEESPSGNWQVDTYMGNV